MYEEVPAWLVVPVAVMAFVSLVALLHRRRAVSPARIALCAVVCVYGAGAIANTVLPFYLDKPTSGVPWWRFLHLTPLVGTEPMDMATNVVVFVPFGFLVPLVWRRESLVTAVVAGFGFSLGIELTQLLNAVVGTGGHVADVNDLLANTVGAPIGWGLYVVAQRVPGVRRLVEAATWPERARADDDDVGLDERTVPGRAA